LPPRCSRHGLFRRAAISQAIRLRLRRVSSRGHHTAMDILGPRVIGNGMVAFSIGYLARGYSNAETSTGLRTIGTRSEISGTTCAVIGSRSRFRCVRGQFARTLRPFGVSNRVFTRAASPVRPFATVDGAACYPRMRIVPCEYDGRVGVQLILMQSSAVNDLKDLARSRPVIGRGRRTPTAVPQNTIDKHSNCWRSLTDPSWSSNVRGKFLGSGHSPPLKGRAGGTMPRADIIGAPSTNPRTVVPPSVRPRGAG
jgi:hypothetical protein